MQGESGAANVERVVEGNVFHFAIRGSRLYWLASKGGILSIHVAALDGSGASVLVDGLPVDGYLFEVAATSTHAYYLASSVLHEASLDGTVVDFPLLDSSYGMLADDEDIFVKLARGGAVRIAGPTQQSYPDVEVITVTQTADDLYWAKGDRVFRQSKRSATGPVSGPLLGSQRINALAVDGGRVFGLTDTAVVDANFDAMAALRALPSTTSGLGGDGPIVASGGRLYWIAADVPTNRLLEMPATGGEAVALYRSATFAPVLEVHAGYVYFADKVGGVLRIPVNQ